MELVYYIVLVPMVYLAFAVFIVGILYQGIRVSRKPKFLPRLQIYPVKRPIWFWTFWDAFTLPSVRRDNPMLWIVLMAFHASFILVLIGHLELIAEMKWIQVIKHEIFIGKGFLGIIMSVALLFFLFRRLISPTKELSVPEDYLILILLFLTVIFGSEMDWARRWFYYEELGVEGYRSYLSSLLELNPDLSEIRSPGHSLMLVLHVFFANLFLMAFPFTNLVHSMFSIPLNKLRRG
jgi:nitrate reductase gamma subunit